MLNNAPTPYGQADMEEERGEAVVREVVAIARFVSLIEAVSEGCLRSARVAAILLP